MRTPNRVLLTSYGLAPSCKWPVERAMWTRAILAGVVSLNLLRSPGMWQQ